MATTSDVICISDDDENASRPPRTPPRSVDIKQERRRSSAPSFDESVLLSSPDSTPTRASYSTSMTTATATNKRSLAVASTVTTSSTTTTAATTKTTPKTMPKTTPKRARKTAATTRTPPSKAEIEAFLGGFRTPERRRRSDDKLKPITPSTSVQSSMNASLVFDMVTSLSTNDPGVAIAALRSVVVLGKEYPSNLLFDELVDRMLSVEAIAYADAVSIYASLVFVYDKAATCSCDLEFPHQWEPLANALQDASVLPRTDERWRRILLVVQFFIYCFKKDFDVCRERYERDDGAEWFYRTRLFALLHNSDAGTSLSGRTTKRASANRLKIQNNLILQAIGCGLSLWQRVYDTPNESGPYVNAEGETIDATLEAEEACMAIVRLIEMLYLCTDQVQNILGRLQAGLLELSRETRVVFSQALQLADLKARLATTVMGLTNKSRSKEHEWYECNALGRLMLSMNSENVFVSTDVATTDGYSWSHYDSFMSSTPRSAVAELLQEVVRLQKNE